MAGDVVYADIRIPESASRAKERRAASRRLVHGLHKKSTAKECEWKNSTGNSATVPPTPSCPLHWEQHGRKCYYFPGKTDEKSWSASHEDCSSRSSRLVVIEDEAELEHLTSKLTIQAWIGLFITAAGWRWTWVNGSALNGNVFSVTGPADGGRCGAVNSGSIASSSCTNSLFWICQKDADSCGSRV
ncbi:killer cell lectin-like receptor subfamily B member 1A isoform X2 [Pleurodeles waltl]|uniref:killer cell lectin-like receptor subfamily B member 1A isoform X2 n=1 Tax=Pleurodeles waltl TaxID=8319 RepID=UPI003709905F